MSEYNPMIKAFKKMAEEIGADYMLFDMTPAAAEKESKEEEDEATTAG